MRLGVKSLLAFKCLVDIWILVRCWGVARANVDENRIRRCYLVRDGQPFINCHSEDIHGGTAFCSRDRRLGCLWRPSGLWADTIFAILPFCWGSKTLHMIRNWQIIVNILFAKTDKPHELEFINYYFQSKFSE